MSYEIIQKRWFNNKGDLSGAVAGGILFGSVGAIVGSNIGKRKLKRN